MLCRIILFLCLCCLFNEIRSDEYDGYANINPKKYGYSRADDYDPYYDYRRKSYKSCQEEMCDCESTLDENLRKLKMEKFCAQNGQACVNAITQITENEREHEISKCYFTYVGCRSVITDFDSDCDVQKYSSSY